MITAVCSEELGTWGLLMARAAAHRGGHIMLPMFTDSAIVGKASGRLTAARLLLFATKVVQSEQPGLVNMHKMLMRLAKSLKQGAQSNCTELRKHFTNHGRYYQGYQEVANSHRAKFTPKLVAAFMACCTVSSEHHDCMHRENLRKLPGRIGQL